MWQRQQWPSFLQLRGILLSCTYHTYEGMAFKYTHKDTDTLYLCNYVRGCGGYRERVLASHSRPLPLAEKKFSFFSILFFSCWLPQLLLFSISPPLFYFIYLFIFYFLFFIVITSPYRFSPLLSAFLSSL